jgi:hypothetical protein
MGSAVGQKLSSSVKQRPSSVRSAQLLMRQKHGIFYITQHGLFITSAPSVLPAPLQTFTSHARKGSAGCNKFPAATGSFTFCFQFYHGMLQPHPASRQLHIIGCLASPTIYFILIHVLVTQGLLHIS